MAQSIPVREGSLTSPRVRRITSEAPWHWLEAGWRDMLKTPLASLFYGLVFVIMGYYLTNMVAEHFHLALALTAGFLLVGPFLAMGLYDLSHCLEQGKPATLGRFPAGLAQQPHGHSAVRHRDRDCSDYMGAGLGGAVRRVPSDRHPQRGHQYGVDLLFRRRASGFC